MLTAAVKYASNSPLGGGVGYMGGSVLEDKKTGHWYIQVRWNGKTEKFFTFEYRGHWFHFETKEQGNKILGVIQDDIDNDTFTPAAYRKDSPLSISKYVDTWLPLADVVKNTRKRYKSYSNQFVSFFSADKDIRKISKVDILQLKKHLEDAGYSKKTVYHVLNTMKTMLNFARDNKDINYLPSFPKLTNPIKGNIEYLNFEDQQKILNEIPERHRPIFELCAEYGLRPQEGRALMKDAVTDTHIIIMRRLSEYELLEGDKAGKIRPYLKTDRAREILKSAAPSFSAFVFTHNGKASYDEKILNKLWHEACDKVGIKMKLYNGLRHSRAGQLLDAKYPIELVSELLGHSKIQMTRDMYGRISQARINDALEEVRVLPFTANLLAKNQESKS